MSTRKDEPNLERLRALVAEHLKIIAAERLAEDIAEKGSCTAESTKVAVVAVRSDWTEEGPVSR